MGTPSRIRSSTPSRVDDILAKARDLLVRDGYADFNLRKLAAEVGVRLNTIQYHFESRDALLAAAITKALESWGRGYEEIAKAPGTVDRKLRDIQRLSVDFLEEPSTEPLLIECFALAQHNAFIREIVQKQYYEYRKMFMPLLREVRPDLSDDELMGFATVYVAQMEGLLVVIHPDDPHRPKESTLRIAIDCQVEAFVAAVRNYRSLAKAAKRKRRSNVKIQSPSRQRGSKATR
jgi:AcrR family transcriptional regulator